MVTGAAAQRDRALVWRGACVTARLPKPEPKGGAKVKPGRTRVAIVVVGRGEGGGGYERVTERASGWVGGRQRRWHGGRAVGTLHATPTVSERRRAAGGSASAAPKAMMLACAPPTSPIATAAATAARRLIVRIDPPALNTWCVRVNLQEVASPGLQVSKGG